MNASIKELISTKNYAELRHALSENPALANEEIPFDEINTATAHPLHRICDGVFSNTYTDDEGLEMAKIFLEFGAHVDGNKLVVKKDSPLVAASSLHADKVAILYIDNGADLNHGGCYGGTALHWAAWCGRPIVVEKLIQAGADINKKSIEYDGTPLDWAFHSLKEGEKKELSGLFACIKMLLNAGAEKNITGEDLKTILDEASTNDPELRELLK